jgi:hypothetical protein
VSAADAPDQTSAASAGTQDRIRIRRNRFDMSNTSLMVCAFRPD